MADLSTAIESCRVQLSTAAKFKGMPLDCVAASALEIINDAMPEPIDWAAQNIDIFKELGMWTTPKKGGDAKEPKALTDYGSAIKLNPAAYLAAMKGIDAAKKAHKNAKGLSESGVKESYDVRDVNWSKLKAATVDKIKAKTKVKTAKGFALAIVDKAEVVLPAAHMVNMMTDKLDLCITDKMQKQFTGAGLEGMFEAIAASIEELKTAMAETVSE